MYKEKRSLPERYTSFMGSWMAGSFIGYVLGKIIVFCIVLWFISKFVCAG